jgi:hypothetical protein
LVSRNAQLSEGLSFPRRAGETDLVLTRNFGRKSSSPGCPAFAFQLAREKTGRTIASYKTGEGSRAGLMLDPTFAAAFSDAKQRIRAMDYRFVEEGDQNRQALLEIYCAVVLNTRYNDFGTH